MGVRSLRTFRPHRKAMAYLLSLCPHRPPFPAVIVHSLCALSPHNSSMSAAKPEISRQAQEEQQKGGVPPAKPTGTLQDKDPNELIEKRNQVPAASECQPAPAAVLLPSLCAPHTHACLVFACLPACRFCGSRRSVGSSQD